jgi:heptaprenylglyceryl phosphate synthase
MSWSFNIFYTEYQVVRENSESAQFWRKLINCINIHVGGGIKLQKKAVISTSNDRMMFH